jgi:hypothetical protein
MKCAFKRLSLLSSLLLGSFCAREERKPQPQLVAPTPIPRPDERGQPKNQVNIKGQRLAFESFYPEEKLFIDENSACRFWDNLESVENPAGDEPLFQLIDALEMASERIAHYSAPAPLSGIAPSRPYYPGPTYSTNYFPTGRVIPKNLPHILYLLSQESEDSNVKNLHSPPTVQGVRDRLSSSGWTDRMKEWWASDASLMKGRNQFITEMLERLIPGVLSQKPGRLNGSRILDELHVFSKQKFFGMPEEKALKRLTKKVPLFRSSSWYEREKELRRMLLILDRPDVSRLSFEEKVCHFAIFHRLTAQLVSLKGVKNAPKLEADGFMSPLPLTSGRGIETENYLGQFQTLDARGDDQPVIITQEWLVRELQEKNLNTSTLHLKSAKVPLEELAAIRYFTTLTSFRSKRIWNFEGVDSCADGRPCIPAKLLKMGMGLHCVLLYNFKRVHVDPTLDMAATRLHLLPDQPNVLALLIHVVLENMKSFERLGDPKRDPLQYKMDSAILSAEQMKLFSDPQKGLVKLLKDIQVLLALEAQYRLLREEPHPRLQHALWRLLHTNEENP